VIIDVPVANPVTTPNGSIVAAAVVPLVHVPPGVASLSDDVVPAHNPALPVMATGGGVMVTVAMEVQPPSESRYVMFEVPAITPVTMPVNPPTVAILVFPLVQPPPGVGLLSVVVESTQIVLIPVIGAGALDADIAVVIMQPVGSI
jgi:hypothetical protein